MAGSMNDDYFWQLRLQSQQNVQRQQMEELDGTAPVRKDGGKEEKKALTIRWGDGVQKGDGITRPALTIPTTDRRIRPFKRNRTAITR